METARATSRTCDRLRDAGAGSAVQLWHVWDNDRGNRRQAVHLVASLKSVLTLDRLFVIRGPLWRSICNLSKARGRLAAQQRAN